MDSTNLFPMSRSKSHSLRDRLDALNHRTEIVAKLVEERISRTQDGIGCSLDLIALRCDLTDQRLNLMMEWMELMSHQADRNEGRDEVLSRRIDGQDKTLRLMCEVLKQIDDPYGFGQSVDEWIAGDDDDSAWKSDRGAP
jgi:hypothetical protein